MMNQWKSSRRPLTKVLITSTVQWFEICSLFLTVFLGSRQQISISCHYCRIKLLIRNLICMPSRLCQVLRPELVVVNEHSKDLKLGLVDWIIERMVRVMKHANVPSP